MLGESLKQTIIISGINMMDGGALTIITECLNFLEEHLSQEFTIYALVHDKSLFLNRNIRFIEFKDAKSSWLKRIKYEYFYFKDLSEELNPYLWLSLHDITPNVKAQIRAVYCHNPAPFYKSNLKTLQLDPKLVAFSIFYKYLYKINILKNDYVIVQQQWLRDQFNNLFGLKNILVADPTVTSSKFFKPEAKAKGEHNQQVKFFYPSFPRVFKNLEVVFEASKLLQKRGYRNFKVTVTLKGDENKYASYLYSLYRKDPLIEWKGLLPRKEVFELYDMADCLLFPSKLETWGLPITEFRKYDKPMLLADLPYARETAANFSKAKFIDVDSASHLADAMEGIIQNSLKFDIAVEKKQAPSELDVVGWDELFKVLLLKK